MLCFLARWGINWASLGGVVLRYPVDRCSITLNLNFKVLPKLAARESQALAGCIARRIIRALFLHQLQPHPHHKVLIVQGASGVLSITGLSALQDDHRRSVKSPSQYCPFCRPDCQVCTTHFPPGANCRMSDQTFHSLLMHTAPTKITISDLLKLTLHRSSYIIGL